MTQADSVHSTPPTNTSPTRRNILGTIAAAGATALTLTPAQAAALGADPIFAAVDEFRRADADLSAAFEPLQEEGVIDKLWVRQEAAYGTVIRTCPTTPAGLAALTTWARERMDWLRKQGSSLEGDKLYELSAAIDDATRGMSGLEPWSPPPSAAVVRAAAPATDPIYAAIEQHKAACVPWDAAIDVRAEFPESADRMTDEQWEQRDALDDAVDEARDVLGQAGLDLINTAPTTATGIVTAIRYMQRQMRTDGTYMPYDIEFEFDDLYQGDGGVVLAWINVWLDTIAAAELDRAGKAVQS